ncbi:MAG: hypothetical protein R2932_48510 [Caldilineaceae bacterium]
MRWKIRSAIQAFWLFALNQYTFVDESGATYLPVEQPIYIASEADIEWNNWFENDKLSRLSAANNGGPMPILEA